ncbi:hypothetical protein KM043_016748 [Ampulex compressa]|nr:hypothetical protein KM043_016748 [Ampulex compressa]
MRISTSNTSNKQYPSSSTSALANGNARSERSSTGTEGALFHDAFDVTARVCPAVSFVHRSLQHQGIPMERRKSWYRVIANVVLACEYLDPENGNTNDTDHKKRSFPFRELLNY